MTKASCPSLSTNRCFKVTQVENNVPSDSQIIHHSTCATTPTCPQCNSTNLRFNGKSYKGGTTRQRYQCRDCRTSFVYPLLKPVFKRVTDKFPCKYCGSENVKNKGLKRKKFRQFLCRDCGKYFTIRILCFLSENQPRTFKPRIKKPRAHKPKPTTQIPYSLSKKEKMQEIKENYVNQTVDSLVGVPCFMCPEIHKCNPTLCMKLECWK